MSLKNNDYEPINYSQRLGRVVADANSALVKLTELLEFIESPMYKSLTSVHKNLVDAQMYHLQEYVITTNARIDYMRSINEKYL
jgi:hypothetical protein